MSFDPRNPVLRIDPYPTLADLRRRDPVHHSSALDALVLTRFDDVAAVARSPRFGTPRALFLEELRARLGEGFAYEYVSRRLTMYDNPDLARLRSLVLRAFTPRRVEALRPWMTELVARLLTNAEAAATADPDGVVDLREEVFHPLPSLVISELLGIPEADRDFFDKANDPLTHLTAPFLTPEQVRDGERSARAEWQALEKLVAERSRHPGDDLLSALLAAQDVDGGRLEHRELIALVMMLFSAGHHTTRDALCMGVIGLTTHSGQMRLLAENPGHVSGAADEFLRWDSSLAMTTRTARQDTVVGGVEVQEGTRCYLHFLAANRDPAHFDDPDRFDIARTGTQVMSFGGGMHHCLGSALARAELEITIDALRRYPDLELAADPATELEWRTNLVFRGPLTLPVRGLGSTQRRPRSPR